MSRQWLCCCRSEAEGAWSEVELTELTEHVESQENPSNKQREKIEEMFQCLQNINGNDEYKEALKTLVMASEKEQKALLTVIKRVIIHQSFGGCELKPLALGKQLKVFFINNNDIHGVDQQILDKLNSTRSCVTRTDDLQRCDAILLFCPMLGRAGSSVEAAMRKIPADEAVDKPVLLILMHHTREPYKVANETSWREKFPKITQEVRVLYHESQHGLLESPKNQEALQTLKSICGRFIDKISQDEQNHECKKPEMNNMSKDQERHEGHDPELNQENQTNNEESTV